MYAMPTSPRKLLQVYLREEGIAKVDALAKDLGVTRSDVVRAALSITLARPDQLIAHLEAKKAAL